MQQGIGKLSARARLEKLFDGGKFVDLDSTLYPARSSTVVEESSPRENVITGCGNISGRPVFAWAQDYSIFKGTVGVIHARKIIMVMEEALRARAPIVGIIDSEGLRVDDAILYPKFYSPEGMAYYQVLSSGVIPQVCLIMGPCVAEMALSAAIADFLFMVRGTSHICVAQPQEKSAEALIDAWTFAKRSGCCDILAENDEECLQKCRELVSFLPQSNKEKPPLVDTGDNPERREELLLDLVPKDSSKSYSMHRLIKLIVDNGAFFELKSYWAGNLIIGYARFGGQTAGIIANNPLDRGGCLTLDAADKMARFVRFCDAFSIPLIWVADTPAFLPAVDEETRGLIRHGCKVIFCNSETTVPQITVAVRKLYGGGGLAMPGRMLGGDFLIAWPLLERGLMGAKGAVSIIYKKELDAIKDEAERILQEKIRVREIQQRLEMQRSEAAQIFIDPRDTRPRIIDLLKVMSGCTKELVPKKHENIRL